MTQINILVKILLFSYRVINNKRIINKYVKEHSFDFCRQL